jgi:divalent metal cation (Fe/Co/Zn/Cd) transporter
MFNNVAAFLSGLAFLLAYIFEVATVHVSKFISPAALLFAGLFFLVLYVAGAGTYVGTRYNNRNQGRVNSNVLWWRVRAPRGNYRHYPAPRTLTT